MIINYTDSLWQFCESSDKHHPAPTSSPSFFTRFHLLFDGFIFRYLPVLFAGYIFAICLMPIQFSIFDMI